MSHRRPSPSALALAVATLAACGGGGGGGGSWLTFTPAPVAVTTYQGEPAAFTVVAHATKTFAQTINVAIVDADGGIDPAVTITANSGTQYTASLLTAASLPAGVHQGNLVVKLCFDAPGTCQQPVEGSPWSVPYTFTIVGPNLKPLAPIAGLPSWSTAGGDATHAARLPVTFSPADATRRWWLTIPGAEAARGISTLAVDAGRAFVVTTPGGAPLTTLLRAYSEDTGEALWTHDFGLPSPTNGPQVTGPAAAHGQVYVASQVSPQVWALDPATGAVRWTANLATGASPFPTAPTPYGDHLYLGYRGYQDAAGKTCFVKLLPADGSVLWRSCPGYGEGTPVLRGGLLFTADRNLITALRTSDGSTAWTMPVSYDVTSAQAPMAVGDHWVCTRNGSACLDDSSPTHPLTPYLSPYPSLILGGSASAIFEVQNGLTLTARDGATGNPLWSLRGVYAFGEPVGIVTDRILFIGTAAVDLDTHQALAQADLTWLTAISSRGVGYSLRSASGGYRLTAVNLR